MRIRYQPRHGTPDVELRDIKGGLWASWHVGEEREVPPFATCAFQNGDGAAQTVPVADAVFAHGPHFVDADTGKNPLYTCACGSDALEESITNFVTLEQIPLRDAAGRRACMPCFLADHPQWITELKSRGLSKMTIAEAQAIIAKRNAIPPPSAYAPHLEDEE